jgi:hypothetical protein
MHALNGNMFTLILHVHCGLFKATFMDFGLADFFFLPFIALGGCLLGFDPV